MFYFSGKVKMQLLQKNQTSKPKARLRAREKGQVLLEFLINFLIFFFLIWALVEIAMIASTKLLTNYASWAAARAWSVNIDKGDGMNEAKDAAKDVLRAMNWNSSGVDTQKASCHNTSDCLEVNYQTTLGIPAFLAHTPSASVKTLGRAPMPQETIKDSDEAGDNTGK